MNFKDIFLNFFGTFYILVSLLAFYNSITNIGWSFVLWLSYTIFFLIGLGILFRNSYLLGSQFNIAFIPYILWSIDFLYLLVFRKNLWGISTYVFTTRSFLSQFITVQRLFIIPIAFISLYFIKFKRKDFWILSLAQVVVFFILTRLFSDPSTNINCVFKSCLPFDIVPNYYILVWFISAAAMILLVNLFLLKIRAFNARRRNLIPS